MKIFLIISTLSLGVNDEVNLLVDPCCLQSLTGVTDPDVQYRSSRRNGHWRCRPSPGQARPGGPGRQLSRPLQSRGEREREDVRPLWLSHSQTYQYHYMYNIYHHHHHRYVLLWQHLYILTPLNTLLYSYIKRNYERLTYIWSYTIYFIVWWLFLYIYFNNVNGKN